MVKFETLMGLVGISAAVILGIAIKIGEGVRADRLKDEAGYNSEVAFTTSEYSKSTNQISATVLAEIDGSSTRLDERDQPASLGRLVNTVKGYRSTYFVEVREEEYILKVHTDDGRDLFISVADSPRMSKSGLDLMVNKGSKISFVEGNLQMQSDLIGPTYAARILNETDFSRPGTHYGRKRADRIRVLN